MERALALAGVAALLALVPGAEAQPLGAAAGEPCPAAAVGTLVDVSRPIVPIGVAVLRGFTVQPAPPSAA